MMADISKRVVIDIAERIDPMAWIRMSRDDTPRFDKRRQRSIIRARGILFELARRKPEWRAGLTEMLMMKDGGRATRRLAAEALGEG